MLQLSSCACPWASKSTEDANRSYREIEKETIKIQDNMYTSLNEDVPIKEAYPRRVSRTAAPLLTRNSLGGGLKAPVRTRNSAMAAQPSLVEISVLKGGM
jgi:hypothetical protein